jgi:uncharacterized protein
MSVKKQLQSDLTTAMKDRDNVRLGTVRMALTAVTNEEVSGKQARELSDEEVMTVLARELKKRKEAATLYSEAGHADRARAELAEAAVLESYLPSQLTDEELATLVTAAVAETGATEARQMGQVMKTVQPAVAGRADGARVAAEVKRQLSS